MGIQSANRREIPKTTTNQLYHNQDVLQLDLPDLLPPDGDRSPRRPLQICSPSSHKDDSRAGHRHPRPLHPASSCQGSRTGWRLYLERDLSLSLLLLMMLLPRYLQMLSPVFLQTRMLSQLSSSAMLFPELLSRLKMFLMAPLLSRQQEERRSRSPGTDTSTSSHLQGRPGSSTLTSLPPMVSSTWSILCFKTILSCFSL